MTISFFLSGYITNNRLKKASNNKAEQASYSYNGIGRRVSRRAHNIEIDYILDQTKMYNNLLETDGEPFVWDENNLLFRNHETEIRDRLGSPIDMDEFGAKTDAGTLGFTGYMYDDTSGTYFAQAREYMPENGRFAGRDILKGEAEIPRTLNEYAYCHGNPVGFSDYNGLCEEPSISASQKDSLGVSVARKGAEDLIKYGGSDIAKVEKYKLTKSYNANIAYQKSLEEAAKAAGTKPPAPQVRSAMTRSYNKAVTQLDSKAATALKKGTKASKVVGIAGAVASVGYDYYKDSEAGLSSSKKMTNMGVNAAFAAVGVGLMFIPGVNAAFMAGLSLVLIVTELRYKDEIQNVFNSLD